MNDRGNTSYRQQPAVQNTNRIPYGFRPIETDAAVLDAPMWRDGTSHEEHYSGEILLTLTALTPLMVGNRQHPIDEKHSELVPQMLDDGRVLLAGSSLKGMLRSVLADLLQAPMDKVAEHHYTYRPNLGFAKENPKRAFRVAIIESVEGAWPNAKVSVKLLPSTSTVVFVRADAKALLPGYSPGQLISGNFRNLSIEPGTGRSRLEKKDGRSASLHHYIYHYAGGIDGEGIFAEAFNRTSKTYKQVLVAVEQVDEAQTIPLSESLLGAYHRTQEILANDVIGHLSPGHPLKSRLKINEIKEAIHNHAKFQPNQLIYVEVEPKKGKATDEIERVTSMGHHFQYRWGYTSSVRYKNRLLNGKGILRRELALHPEENADTQGTPKKLSGARLLFGYAVEGQNEEQGNLAKNNFKRLAGRISFNTAIEVPGDKTKEQRFVNGGDEVQLQVLGMPRPSAVEFYLKQDQLPQTLNTYGDLPDDAGGELAGRKYYRHQPDARTRRDLYSPVETENGGANIAERGTVVCYLSEENSRFHCTLRFDSLRLWELGAMLAALEPKRIEKCCNLPQHNEGYAHKLGYGKPLGLGSVRIKIDGARWHKNGDWAWQQWRDQQQDWQLGTDAVKHLQNKFELTLGECYIQSLQNWLRARQWKLQGHASYPVSSNKGVNSIFAFHSKLRRDHAQARRSSSQKGDPTILRELKGLLEKE